VAYPTREYLSSWSEEAVGVAGNSSSFALPADLSAVVAEWRAPSAVWASGDEGAAASTLLTTATAQPEAEGGEAPPLTRALARTLEVAAPSATALRMASQLRLVASFPDKVPAGSYLWEAVRALPPAEEGGEARYAVRMFVGGVWRSVVVDDAVPVDAEGRCTLPCAAPARSGGAVDTWPAVLCKAYLSVRAAAGAACAELDGSDAIDDGFVRCLTGWLAQPVDDRSVAAMLEQGGGDAAPSTLVCVRAVCRTALSGIAATNDSIAFRVSRTNDAADAGVELHCARPADIYAEWRDQLKSRFDALISDAKAATAPRDAVVALLTDPANAALVSAAAMYRPGQLARMQQAAARAVADAAAANERAAAAAAAEAGAKAAGDKAAAVEAKAAVAEAAAAAKAAEAPPPPLTWEQLLELFENAPRVPRWVTVEQFGAHFDVASAIALHSGEPTAPAVEGESPPPRRHAQINAHFRAAPAAPPAEEGEGGAVEEEVVAGDAAADAADADDAAATVDAVADVDAGADDVERIEAGEDAPPAQLVLVTKPCEILFNLTTAAVRAGTGTGTAVYLEVVPVALPLGVDVLGPPLLQMRCSAACAGLGAAASQLSVKEASVEAPRLLRVTVRGGVAAGGGPAGASLGVLCLGGKESAGACAFGSHLELLPALASSAVTVSGVVGSAPPAAAAEYRVLFQQSIATTKSSGAPVAAVLHISDPSVVPFVRMSSQMANAPLPFALPLLALPDVVVAGALTLTAFVESDVALPPFEWQLSVACDGDSVALASAVGGEADAAAAAKGGAKAKGGKAKKGAPAAEEESPAALPAAAAPLRAAVYEGAYILNRDAAVLSHVLAWSGATDEEGNALVPPAADVAAPVVVRLQVGNPAAHLVLELLQRGTDGADPEVLASSRGASSVELICATAGEAATGATGELLLRGRLDTSKWALPAHLLSPLPLYCCGADPIHADDAANDAGGMPWRLEVVATPSTVISLTPDTTVRDRWGAVQATWNGSDATDVPDAADALKVRRRRSPFAPRRPRTASFCVSRSHPSSRLALSSTSVFTPSGQSQSERQEQSSRGGGACG
jgi:hypothetical protein